MEQRRLVQTRGRLEPTTPDAVQPRRTASGHAGHRPTSPAGGRPRPARPTTGRPPACQSDQAGLRPTYEFRNVKTPEFKLAALSGRFWDTSFFGSMVNHGGRGCANPERKKKGQRRQSHVKAQESSKNRVMPGSLDAPDAPLLTLSPTPLRLQKASAPARAISGTRGPRRAH